MASVDTMPTARAISSQERGRLKLEQFKQRRKGTKSKAALSSEATPPETKVHENGNSWKPESSTLVSVMSFSEDGNRKEHDEEEVKRKEFEAEEKKRKVIEAEEVNRMEREAEDARRRQREAEELRNMELRKVLEAEEAERKQREAEDAKRFAAELLKRRMRDAEEERRRQREAEEVKRREREKEAIDRKEREAEEGQMRQREAEEALRKAREADDLKRRQREAEEARRKEHEQFASLEQHIQDLTEEKFALQRSLDKARSMTQDLASENSTLMEDFNNQGQVTNQLREDIERLELRIQEQEKFAKSLISEKERAQQESAAALEQSQTLAGEVVDLENRIRKLRSNELKMERDMSNLTSEVESHKKHVASWEKDRTHLKSIIEALQEEKKVLQVRLRKLATGERDVSSTTENSEAAQPRERNLMDASTSTEDLQIEPITSASEGPSTPLASPSLDSWQNGRQFEEEQSSSAQTTEPRSIYVSSHRPLPLSTDQRSQLISSEHRPPPPPPTLNLPIGSPQSGDYRAIHLPALSSSIPAEVVRTINNINDVITSISEEKTALVIALKAESKGAAELRALNADLSRKLEATTQQLELVVAQRMAEGSLSTDFPTPRSAPAALDYVDEGDEVVDRVFTWIMQLFPGRNSRRNGVKRL